MNKIIKIFTIVLVIGLFLVPAFAQDKTIRATEIISKDGRTMRAVEVIPKDSQAASVPALDFASSIPANANYFDPLKYTLGPEDVVEITVMRHPEFSGVYPINLEGKIQYKFVGDIEVTGLTKKELEEKIKELVANFIISPEINITILDYKSKVIYVLGEVARPGKYYMRSENIPVREAVVQAGLPTLAAAMRKCELITPSENGKGKKKKVDLYSILYGGELKKNIEMKPGDVFYVPATVMAKIMRVINPVVAPVGTAASGVRSATTMTP
ncbi:MAG: polysaccharide export protein [Candidatus Omnitrophica bacterium]|nr:polysaccharide export protein [Candidatus Omnitrophota bacterium]